MATFSITNTIAGVGERINCTIAGIDSSKGFYITIIRNYDSSMDDYSLAQLGQSMVGWKRTQSISGTGTVISYVDVTEDIYNMNVQTLTIVYFDNYADFSSLTDFEENVTLGQYTAKSENFTVTIYKGKKLTGVVTWLRNWFNTKEEHDEMLLTDSDWKTCTLSSGYTAYTSGTTLRVRKVGKLVQVSGVVKNTNALSSSSGTFANIPSGYRPHHNINHICQGSNMNRWALVIGSGGDMKFFRYGADSLANPVSGTWFPYTLTYLVD